MKKVPAVWLWILPVLSGLVFVALWYGVRAASGLQSWILPTPDKTNDSSGFAFESRINSRIRPVAKFNLEAIVDRTSIRV